MALAGALALACLPATTFSANRDALLEEVVVTATKREESIQDIPIAVSAFAGEDLTARGVHDLYGLQEVSPSISVYSSNSTSNGGTLRIRGVGTTGNNPGLEAAVGTFIDGVYRSRAGQAFADLVDIERVEVLRGPQGTLFGKNTSAGALQILTREPEFQQGGNASVAVGDFGTLRGHVSLTGPLTERIAYRASLQTHQREGFYEDDNTGDAYDSRDRYTFKGQLLFNVTDNVETRFIYDYTERDEDCCPANYEYFNASSDPTKPLAERDGIPGTSSTTRGFLAEPAGDIVNDLLDRLDRPQVAASSPHTTGGHKDDWTVGVNHKPVEDVKDWGLQNQTSWQINDRMELKSITAYREYDVFRQQDIDFSGADILQPQNINEKFENFSQEFQFTWNTDRVDYLFGLYFYTEDIVSDESIRIGSQGAEFLSRYIIGSLGLSANVPSTNTTLCATPIGSWDNDSGSYIAPGDPRCTDDSGTAVDRPNFRDGDGYTADYFQETEGWSVFTREVVRLSDKWDLTVGLRFSSETKEASTWINGVAPIKGETETQLLQRMIDNEFNEAHCTGRIFVGFGCNIVSWTDEETEEEWSGTITLNYAWTDTVNAFFSYSRGYKAGGYNLDQQAIEMDSFATWLAVGGDLRFLDPDKRSSNGLPQELQDAQKPLDSACSAAVPNNPPAANTNPLWDNPFFRNTRKNEFLETGNSAKVNCLFFDDDHAFEPEFVDSYEVGIKAELMGGDLIANVSAFFSDYEDFQLNTFTGTGFLISNTDQMIAKGVELETTWFFTDNLLWTFGVTYADARYGDDLNADTTELDLVIAQDYKTLEDWRALEDIEGRQITHAPYWQGNSSLFFQGEVGSVIGYGNVNLSFRGAHNTGSNLKNEKDESDKALLNLQLGLRMPDDSWDLQVWATNLTDKQIDTLVFDSVFQGESYSTFLNPPRMVGITLLTNW